MILFVIGEGFVYAHFDNAGSYNSFDKKKLIINEWAGCITVYIGASAFRQAKGVLFLISE